MEGDTFKVPSHVLAEADGVIGSTSPANEILIEDRPQEAKPLSTKFLSVIGAMYDSTARAYEDLGMVKDAPQNSKIPGLSIPSLEQIQEAVANHFTPKSQDFIAEQSRQNGKHGRLLITPDHDQVSLPDLNSCFNRLSPKLYLGKSRLDTFTEADLEARAVDEGSILRVGGYAVTFILSESRNLEEVFRGYARPQSGDYDSKFGYFKSEMRDNSDVSKFFRVKHDKFLATQELASSTVGITLSLLTPADFIIRSAIDRTLGEGFRQTVFTQLPVRTYEEQVSVPEQRRVFRKNIPSYKTTESKQNFLGGFMSRGNFYFNDPSPYYKSTYGLQLAIAK